MPSLHDSVLIGYEVDGSTRTIVLHTSRHPPDGMAADVKFTGVVAYHLEGDCLQNIILDIIEVSIEAVVGDGRAFSERHHQYGWPSGWDSRREGPEQFLRSHGCRCFELSSSYGMSGWIAAERMEIFVKDVPL